MKIVLDGKLYWVFSVYELENLKGLYWCPVGGVLALDGGMGALVK